MKWTASSFVIVLVFALAGSLSLYELVFDHAPPTDTTALEPDGLPFDDGTRMPSNVPATLDSIWAARHGQAFSKPDTTITADHDTTIYLR